MKRFYPVIFITILIIVSVSLISITNYITLTYTQFKQDYETVEQFKGIFQNISYYKYDNETEVYTIYDDNKIIIGYGFYAIGRGYGGYIRILVGLENKTLIKDIVVILHHETNDYWNLLIKHEFFSQFTELKIKDCYLIRDNGLVDSVTRATTSAKAVVDTVRETALKKITLMDFKMTNTVTQTTTDTTQTSQTIEKTTIPPGDSNQPQLIASADGKAQIINHAFSYVAPNAIVSGEVKNLTTSAITVEISVTFWDLKETDRFKAKKIYEIAEGATVSFSLSPSAMYGFDYHYRDLAVTAFSD